MNQPAPYNPYPARTISPAERHMILGQRINWYTGSGWRIAGGHDYEVVLASQTQPMNHILHLLLAVVTCGLWAPVWLVIALTHKPAGRTLTVSVDEYGQIATR